MENFIQYLLQYSMLNQQQIDLIKQNMTVVELEKGTYFSEAGKTAQEVAFVNDGILRVCYFDKNGNEITRYFVDEDNFAVDLNSFNNRIPSSEYIQAVVPTELYIMTRQNLETLSQKIVVWDSIMHKITENALVEKLNRISPMMAEDTKTRYLEFFNRFPSLANRIPVQYLASYIGVTKHSLSRIRKELTQ